MAKRSKAYKAAEAKIEEGKLYTPAEAVASGRRLRGFGRTDR